MERIERNITPFVLYKQKRNEFLYIRKGRAWFLNYSRHQQANRFKWGMIAENGVNIRLNSLLLDTLQIISSEHCYYCDRKQLRKGDVRPTIDHFYPKTKRLLKAFYWPNLFLACDSCQEYKSTLYTKYLLKFDDDEYNFSDYFYIDFTTGRVLSRQDITPESRCKARVTLMILGINMDKRQESRLEELNSYLATDFGYRNIDNFSFRYYINRNNDDQNINNLPH
jgi:hypothetical protein